MEVKKTKVVYRMQNKDGTGPYSGDCFWDGYWNKRNHSPDPHPCPVTDGIDMDKYKGWKFGFKTKKAANRWFTKKDQKELASQGYTIHKLTCKEIKNSSSGRQCVWT